MGTKSMGGPQRCRIILQGCLAIQLSKPGHTPEDFWMYDSGYMIFQNFLAANAKCWWNAPLTAATRALKYAGHVAPGMLLVTAEPCALEVLRGAYARSVLKPPETYVIISVGDIDDCIVTPTVQGQFTPLPEALCDVIMDLTSQGKSATIENIKTKLITKFPHMTIPATEVIYDTLVQLMQEKKIYQTSKGYFIFTPERKRSRSCARNHRSFHDDFDEEGPHEARFMLMTNSEALHSFYGEISTERDGDVTHQCIQTNLADVICGGNPNDKILYPRTSKRRSASFPTPRSLDRRHSLRLFGSSKRLNRCVSTRSLSKTCAQTLVTDSSSSEYQSTDSSSPKKGSLLSRLFRRSGRKKHRQIETFSAQFPPVEWFNSRAVHLHSIGTQTNDHDVPVTHTLSNSTFYDGSEISQRSSTLPRRHRRHMSSESTFMISSRDCSPIRQRSPAYYSRSLNRSTQSIPVSSNQNPRNPGTSVSNTQQETYIKSQKMSSAKHHFEEQNKPMSNKRFENISENKILRRNVHSGPSSLESGKTSSLITSGPSSIESGKISHNKSSGHSSLNSQLTSKTLQSSPSGSILILKGSPRSSKRHQFVNDRTSPTKNTTKINEISDKNHPETQNSNKSNSGILNSDSNSSITLQVTTSNGSQSSLPSTKIYVQNSPVRSVITLENGKLNENSNVFIINNETTANEKGDLIAKTATATKQQSTPTKNIISTTKHNDCINENDENSETCDSISYKSETFTDNHHQDISDSSEVIESNKFAKNINNDTNMMNNSRKFYIQNSSNSQTSNNIVYKNILKMIQIYHLVQISLQQRQQQI